MTTGPGAFEREIEGLAGLSAVSAPERYDQLTLYQGLLGGSRPVEVRVLPEGSDPDAVDEFLGVADRWADISGQPAVVELLGSGEEPAPWVLVDGSYDRPLAAVAPGMGDSERCDAIDEIASALATASEAGFAHGHLQPADVRFRGDGSAAVDDWGIGRVLAVRTQQPYVTPYTAPEELDSSTPARGPAIDVYRLAAVAYFTFTGQPPHEADPAAIVEGQPAPPSSVTDLPASVDAVFERALSADPADRPESPWGFADQLREGLSGSDGSGAAAGAAGAAAAGAAGAAGAEAAEQGGQPEDAGAAGRPQNAGQAGQPTEGQPSQAAQPRTEGQQPRTQGRPEGGRAAAAGAGAQANEEPTPLDEEEGYDRRTVLAAGGGAAALAFVGVGAWRFLGDEDDQPSNQEPLERVPAGADAVAHGNLAALLSDPAFLGAVDGQLGGEGDLEMMLDSFATETGIDFREADDVTIFATGQGGATAAAVFRPTTSPEQIRETAADAGRLQAGSEYEGYPLYVIDAPELGRTLTVGDLGGEIAIGSRSSVEGAIDRERGEIESVDGDVRDGFSRAGSGLAQGGFVIPQGAIDTLGLEGYTADLFSEVYGDAVLPEEAGGELQVTLEAPSSGDADSIAELLNQLPTLIENDVLELPPEIDDRLLDALTEVEAEASDTTVVATIPDGYLVAAVLVGYALS